MFIPFFTQVLCLLYWEHGVLLSLSAAALHCVISAGDGAMPHAECEEGFCQHYTEYPPSAKNFLSKLKQTHIIQCEVRIYPSTRRKKKTQPWDQCGFYQTEHRRQILAEEWVALGVADTTLHHTGFWHQTPASRLREMVHLHLPSFSLILNWNYFMLRKVVIPKTDFTSWKLS